MFNDTTLRKVARVDGVKVEPRGSETIADFSAPACLDGKTQFTGVQDRGVTFQRAANRVNSGSRIREVFRSNDSI
jgi:hypothetical protein